MKDKYFGDQTDYIKHGILRFLRRRGVPLGIHWNLTPDDARSDGSRTGYLAAADRWQHYDPELFDAIKSSLADGRRTLKILVERDLLPGAILCFDSWGRDSRDRSRSLDGFMGQLTSNSVVFLDPDNGLEVTSTPHGAPGSTKYVYFDEVRRVWSGGHSVMIYQHFPRVNRRTYVLERLRQLVSGLSYSHAYAVLTSHVAFLGVLQGSGAEVAWQAIDDAVKHWAPQTQLLFLTEKMELAGSPAVPLSLSLQAELGF